MNYPEIRFRDPFLLVGAIYNDIEPAYMPPIAESDERNKLSRQYITDKLKKYEKAWRPYEDEIVKGICQILNVEFRHNVIDIYAAPFYNSFSFPMFIATKYEPNRAIEVITHELLHVLLYDNTSSKLDLHKTSEEWKKLFPSIDNENALIHIPVHATMQALFDDILHEPERTLNDKKMCESYSDYSLAWDYVEQEGYQNIIDKLKTKQV